MILKHASEEALQLLLCHARQVEHPTVDLSGACARVVGEAKRAAGEPVPVIVETPCAGDIERNLTYLRACLHDCLLRGEAPFASHAIYTQPGVLRDELPEERALGIAAGFAWKDLAAKTVVYENLGRSNGMQSGIEHAYARGQCVEFRILGPDWEKQDRE